MQCTEILSSTKLTISSENSLYFQYVCSKHWGYHPMGPKEIDGVLMPPGKAYMLLTGHLITD